jgi:hypothetical protein
VSKKQGIGYQQHQNAGSAEKLGTDKADSLAPIYFFLSWLIVLTNKPEFETADYLNRELH